MSDEMTYAMLRGLSLEALRAMRRILDEVILEKMAGK